MTSKDNTEDLLLSSIRKNKPGGSTSVRKKVAKKAASRKSRAPQRKRSPQMASASRDPYQSGRRVWPD